LRHPIRLRERVARAAAVLGLWLSMQPCAMAEWKLVHEEDFARASGLDRGWWRLETGLHRNQEQQSYEPGNVSVVDGVLRIEARQERVANPLWGRGGDWRARRRASRYTSGSLVTQRPLQFARVEVVARTPSGQGVWPAIWLLHESEGQYGEIDLFEAVGKHPDTVFAGVHHGRGPRARRTVMDSRVVPGFEGRWHTHTLEWTSERITVALDGQVWWRHDPRAAREGALDPLRQPMHLRINLAVGGSWAGPVDPAVLPARFEIASIRVWSWLGTAAARPSQEAPVAGTSGAPGTPATGGPAQEGAGAPVPVPVPMPPSVAAPGGLRWGR
jgi:beta-glucanase (GH16 family)